MLQVDAGALAIREIATIASHLVFEWAEDPCHLFDAPNEIIIITKLKK
jgi:hypothetical protein